MNLAVRIMVGNGQAYIVSTLENRTCASVIWIWLTSLALALIGLDRLLLRLEAKGVIYWRKTKRRRAVHCMSPVSGMFDPASHHLADAREERVLEEEGVGDGDDKRNKAPVDPAAVPDRLLIRRTDTHVR